MLVLILLIILLAPSFIPYKYAEILSINGRRDKGAKNLAPFTYSQMEQKYIAQGNYRFPHIFGTDEQCRDYFVRVIYGTRVSLFVGFFASLIVLVIGLIYGSISGYVGGRTDLIMLSADDTAIYAAYNAGDIDFADTVPTDEVASLLNNAEFHIVDNLGTYYAAFNCKSALFDGKTPEQAACMRRCSRLSAGSPEPARTRCPPGRSGPARRLRPRGR